MVILPGGTPISINEIMTITLLNNIDNAKKQLKTSTKSIPSVSTCKGIILTEYEKRAREISALLDLYKQLLDKDLNETRRATGNLIKVDTEIAQQIFK